MSTHDLRRRVLELYELRRRYEAHDKLSDEEMNILRRGIPDEEYRLIVDAIKGERRNATPSKKVREKKEKQERDEDATKPIDLDQFLNSDWSDLHE